MSSKKKNAAKPEQETAPEHQAQHDHRVEVMTSFNEYDAGDKLTVPVDSDKFNKLIASNMMKVI